MTNWQIKNNYCNWVGEFFEEDYGKYPLRMLIKYDGQGYEFIAVYENGVVLKDWICQEEIDDCLEDMIKNNEEDEEIEEDNALLCCIGWRVDKFKDDGYFADWLEIEEDVD